jgi:plastocyanin
MALRARKHVNLTLGLCIAGGLAAGVALARPASDSDARQSSTTAATATADEPASDGYQYPSVADDVEVVDDAPAAPAASITIADFAFGESITVAPGADVVVTNVDGAPHSVTANDNGFDTGVLNTDQEATIVAPDSPGTYAFFCVIHPSMQGELVVG